MIIKPTITCPLCSGQLDTKTVWGLLGKLKIGLKEKHSDLKAKTSAANGKLGGRPRNSENGKNKLELDEKSSNL